MLSEEHNRTSSFSSSTRDEEVIPKTSGKTKNKNRIVDDEAENGSASSVACLEAGERKELEKFLFEESNKINIPAIRFIFEKWAAIESRL